MASLLVVFLLALDDGKLPAGSINPKKVTHRPVELTVLEAFTEAPLPFTKGAKSALVPALGIRVRIKNLDKERPVEYAGWTGRNAKSTDKVASASTEKGEALERIWRNPLRKVSEQLQDVTIEPGKEIEDVLLFARPTDEFRSIDVYLPGGALEMEESFSFTVNREAWSTAGAAPAGTQPEITGIELVDVNDFGTGALIRMTPSKKFTMLNVGGKVGGWTVVSISKNPDRIVVTVPGGQKETMTAAAKQKGKTKGKSKGK